MTRPEELDARGRRLRAALAAVLVCENTPELKLTPVGTAAEAGNPALLYGLFRFRIWDSPFYSERKEPKAWSKTKSHDGPALSHGRLAPLQPSKRLHLRVRQPLPHVATIGGS